MEIRGVLAPRNSVCLEKPQQKCMVPKSQFMNLSGPQMPLTSMENSLSQINFGKNNDMLIQQIKNWPNKVHLTINELVTFLSKFDFEVRVSNNAHYVFTDPNNCRITVTYHGHGEVNSDAIRDVGKFLKSNNISSISAYQKAIL